MVTGATGIDPGVEVDRRLDALVAEELPDDLIRSGVAVEDYLSGKVSEGMRVELDADMAFDGFLNQRAHARSKLAAAIAIDEDMRRPMAEKLRGKDVAKLDQHLGNMGGNIERDRHSVLHFVIGHIER